MPAETRTDEPIAIIGSGCRLPGGSSSPSRLWELLKSPRVVASEPPAARFDINSFYHDSPNYPGTTNAKESYYLSDDPRRFDAPFFNISATEAESIDPQQRQLLETVYESLENAGLRLDSLQGSPTGIFCGVMNNDWGELLATDCKSLPRYMATGAARSIIANRVSYFFDWRGPSEVVDTACSSSMVALHHAVTALQQKECSLALATGTNLIQAPNIFISTTKIQMLSPTSRSRMWDAQADGYARGEGVISIVLKRLSDAIADGDSIDCIIRATGTNQDGRTMGITMPSSVSQLQLIEDTYARAGLNPKSYEDRCQYFEAHGTGTLAGDPEEASAIYHAFFGALTRTAANLNGTPEDDRKEQEAINGTPQPDNILLVGSVKTVIGHTEGTAGLAGVLKASLSLQNGLIPPNLLFETLNPALEPFASNLKVAMEATPWPRLPPGVPRRVSVNSFGFGGTNAHAILESYSRSVHNGMAVVESPPLTAARLPAVLPFVFSAASERSLVAVISSYAEYLRDNPSIDPAGFATTLLRRRSALKFRLSLWAPTIPDLVNKLEEEVVAIQAKRSPINSRRLSDRPQILGVFTGQGAQWTQMGWDLISASPQARIWIDEMEQSLAQLPPRYRPSFSLINEIASSTSKMTSASLSQPLCTALQIVFVNILTTLGVRFAAVVGHSSGEIAAAYAVGLLTATDAIRIAYLRGFVAPLAGGKNNQRGAMLAAGLSAESAAEICAEFEGRVALAASNSASTVTFSGDADAIEDLQRKLKDEGKFCRLLRVDTAYHSHHMDPCSAPYLEALEECGISPLSGNGSTWFSSVNPGADMNINDQTTPLSGEYWKDNMLSPVLFSQALTSALNENGSLPDLIIEVGPHPALKGPVQQVIADTFPTAPDIKYIAPCNRDRSGFESLSSVVGSIWETGGPAAADLTHYVRLFNTSKVYNQPEIVKGLPTYPFDHSRAYITQSRMLNRHLRHRGVPHPLLGTLEPESADGEKRWRHYLRQTDLDWLDGHRVQSQIVFPATGYLAMAIEAACLVSTRSVRLIQLDEFIIHQAIMLPDDESMGIETLFRLTTKTLNDATLVGDFHIHASTGDDFQIRASGRLTVTWGEPQTDTLPPPNDQSVLEMSSIDLDEFYTFLSKIGYGYTGLFRGIRGLSRAKDMSRGEVQNMRRDGKQYPFLIHPAVLDCTLQTMLAALGAPGDGEIWTLLVPTYIKSTTINPALCGTSGGEIFVSDAEVINLNATKISGDVSLYTQNGRGVVHMEGIEIAPLLQPPTDRLIFSELVWGPMAPGRKPYQDPVDFSTHALTVERIALLYIKLVKAQLTPDDERKFDKHRSRLASWIDRTLSLTRAGDHPILCKDWLQDTQEDLDALIETVSGLPISDISATVGATLPRFFRGEASILEEIRKVDGFTRFYRHDLETNIMNERLGDVVGQLAFRYPRLKILEIGAGTGSATRAILEKIGRSYHSYTFTDISVGFFEEAKSAFSEHEDRFIYAPLNIENDPAGQNFEDHSFDLIVAANCLHATKSMNETMTHVRQLLKPGGYLVLLEITNTDTIRTTFLMGGLEGWWAGENDGRVWGPMLNVSSWEKLLCETGFGGIDLRIGLGDPQLSLYEVIVSEAVDDRIRLLRDPLSTSPGEPGLQQPDNLLIVGGSTNITSTLVKQISDTLRSRFRRITAAPEVELLELPDSSSSIVLSLIDIDRPSFQDLTLERLEGLQKLVSTASKLLWVTAGPESDCPYLGMSKGWLRSLAYERRGTVLQYLNIENPAAVSAELLATSLMRLVYADSANDHTMPDLVYTTEHELYYRNGTMQICRLRNEDTMNQRYISARRWVSTLVDRTDSRTVLCVVPETPGRYDVRVAERQLASSARDERLLIRVQYSTAGAIAIDNGFLQLVIGEEERTGARLLAFSDKHENVIRVPADWVCKVPEGLSACEGAAFLKAVVDVLLASLLLDQSSPNSTLFVHDAGPTLYRTIWSQALVKNIAPFFTTSNSTLKTQNTVFLHPRAPTRVLNKLMPRNVSVAASFEAGSLPDGVFTRVVGQLPKTAIIKFPDSLSQSSPRLPTTHSEQLGNLLRNYCTVATRLFDSNQPLEVLAPDSIAGRRIHPGQVIDWTQQTPVSAHIEPVTSLITLSNDKTYLLAGMTGDLGRSLCGWMVSKGARHVVLASRTPNIDPKDLADRESVIRVYRTIQQQQLPPVGGVVNGALSLEDHLFEDQTLDVLNATFAPKVQGSLLLDELSGPNKDLDFFILFGSITGVVGNFKQTAYSAATGFQSSLIRGRRSRGLVGSIVHPGLISGVGYITRKGSRWVEHVRKTTGSLLLSERDLDKLFAEAILAGHPDSNRNPEIVIGIPLIDPAQNPEIFWYPNPLTWDFIDYAAKAGAQVSGTTATGSIKALLDAVTSIDDVPDIVSAALIAKVRSKLNLSEDVAVTKDTPIRDLGIDSLVAVDLRTWFARELGVDIPLLQIMGGSTVGELTAAAVPKLPAARIPHVQDRKGVGQVEMKVS
ncbi:hypothetical protein BDV12DRAFT_200687 [Aspergillus spectabilis]